MISKGFERLNQHLSLAAYAIVVDLIGFFITLGLIGFSGENKFTLKFAIETGLPSISSVIDQNYATGGINFQLIGNNAGEITSFVFLTFILFLIIGSWIQAGFIGLLHEVVRHNRGSFGLFMDYARRFFIRMLGLEILIILFMIVTTAILLVLLNIVGAILLIILFIVLRILLIYWEFTIVVEDLGVREAFSRCREHFRNREEHTMQVIIAILLTSMVFGLLVNGLWHPVVLFFAIFGYGYIATGLQVALMFTLHQILQKENQIDGNGHDSLPTPAE